MARSAKPWFNKQKNCWMVWRDGKRVKLAGEPNHPTILLSIESGLGGARHENPPLGDTRNPGRTSRRSADEWQILSPGGEQRFGQSR